jgi:hypothetical protein
MALVIATVVVTGLVVANWGGRESDKKAVDISPGRTTPSSLAGVVPARGRSSVASWAPAAGRSMA